MKLNPATTAVVGGLSARSYAALFGRCSPVREAVRRAGFEHRLPEPPPEAHDPTLADGVEDARAVAGRVRRARAFMERQTKAMEEGRAGAA